MNLTSVEALLQDRIGFDPHSLGPAALPRAVRERLRASGMTDPEVYAKYLVADAAEWSALLAHLLVPETWFFRGGRPLFDHLASWVRDRAAALSSARRPVRILSVPCSTGEEPYSLTIAFREVGLAPGDYQIDAVDLSADHLARARAAQYGPFSFRDLSFDPRESFFLKVADDRWELMPRYRESVRFLPGNTVAREFLSGEAPYDLILARNLFIYLTPDGCKRALENLERLLAADGLMCLTPAEADRLPAGQFALDGPVAFALYRRTSGKVSGAIPVPVRQGPRSRSQPLPMPPSAIAPVMTSPPVTSTLPAPSHPKTSGPTRVISPLEIARSLADAGRLDEARTACERLLELHPSADGFALLGVVHIAAGRRVEAAGAFRKSLYLDPDHAEALTHMIVLHEQRGETEPAAALNRRLDRVRRRETA